MRRERNGSVLTRFRSLHAVRVVIRRVGVHRVTLVAGLVQLPARRAVAHVLQRLPRNPRLVVMGSPLDRFADNAAYLFVHMSEHQRSLRPVWISGSSEVVERLREHGYRAERRWSWRGVIASARAGAYVYSAYRSDINAWLSAGAVSVSLWHGIPIKRIERDVGPPHEPREDLLTRLTRLAREAPPDVVLSTSPFVTQCFSAAFGVPPDRCWELGYPRVDHLLAEPSQPPAALVGNDGVWDRLASAPRVVGLFLTWRDDRADDAIDEAFVRRLADMCNRHGALLAYKAHYNVAPTAAPRDCVVLPPDGDLNAYLGLCDVLVTDYSSVALDFLLMGREVLYYMPDLAHYAATRGFTVDPMCLPGTVTFDQVALVEALENVLEASAGWTASESDERFLREMWGNTDGRAARRIAAALESALGLPAETRPDAAGAAAPISGAVRARSAS